MARSFPNSSDTSDFTPKLEGGTYWVQVDAYDSSLCSWDREHCHFPSIPWRVEVPKNPPVITSAGFDAMGHLQATWRLPADLYSDFIEVATSPAVYPDGDAQGEFLVENIVHSHLFTGTETNYVSPVPIPVHPGNYYVHVGTASCPVGFCDIFPISDVYTITVPRPPVAMAAADRTTTIASLRVRSRQSVRTLFVQAQMAEPGTLTASGTIKIAGAAKVLRLHGQSAAAKPDVPVRLHLRASKKVQRAVRRALRRHGRATARIIVTARDAAGNTKAEGRTIRLKR